MRCRIAAWILAFTTILPGAACAAPLTVAQFKATPPASGTVEVIGYVDDFYLCPPCPPGAQCKPCAHPSSIFIADRPPSGEERMRVREIGLAADPAQFERGVQYKFEIVVTEPRDSVVGRVLRGERVR